MLVESHDGEGLEDRGEQRVDQGSSVEGAQETIDVGAGGQFLTGAVGGRHGGRQYPPVADAISVTLPNG
ncbi:hypothetical protein GS492_12065 [Rhodococcus hoagii]|nr:hypothetical protein [Prescottella equi]